MFRTMKSPYEEFLWRKLEAILNEVDKVAWKPGPLSFTLLIQMTLFMLAHLLYFKGLRGLSDFF